MKFHKTSVMIRTILPVCLFIISSVAMNLSAEAGQKIEPPAPDPTTQRLFQNMGIVNIPHIAPPVDFQLKDLDGNTVRLSDFKGKIVFLNFWTTWCPECRYEMPLMQKLYTHFKGRDFAMVAINMNEPAAIVEKYFRVNKLTFITLLDSINELGGPFGIRGIPTTFIIDRDGGIIGRALGSRRWDSKNSITLFEHLINSVEKNKNSSEYEQKKNISYNSIKPDIGTGNSIAGAIYSA
jgi:peroxiredoxin